MYQSTGKPSIAKFKTRLVRIHECAETGKALSRHWNPKGRNAVLHRQLDKYFAETITITEMFLEEMGRR